MGTVKSVGERERAGVRELKGTEEKEKEEVAGDGRGNKARK